jgi:hypothetical protein
MKNKNIFKYSFKTSVLIIVLWSLNSCGYESTLNEPDRTKIEINPNNVESAKELKNEIVSCGNIQFYKRQINKIFLCVSTEETQNHQEAFTLDFSEPLPLEWNIYLDNRSRCSTPPLLCDITTLNNDDKGCSEKMYPIKGSMIVTRGQNKLLFSFSKSTWKSENVELVLKEERFEVLLKE